jgi:tetratricopeptide (TPR) repeat protein
LSLIAGDIPTAITHLEKFLNSAKKAGNKAREGWAQCALASCYESQGENQTAANYLEEFVAAAQNDASQNNSAALACNQLGTLYNRMEKFELAVHFFEKLFRIKERKLDSEVWDDGGREKVKPSTAQVQLAISKANAKSARFFDCVADASSLSTLLLWKCQRTFGESESIEV